MIRGVRMIRSDSSSKESVINSFCYFFADGAIFIEASEQDFTDLLITQGSGGFGISGTIGGVRMSSEVGLTAISTVGDVLVDELVLAKGETAWHLAHYFTKRPRRLISLSQRSTISISEDLRRMKRR